MYLIATEHTVSVPSGLPSEVISGIIYFVYLFVCF